MGLDVHAVRFVLSSARAGIDFSRTVMIGRQSLHVDARTLRRLLEESGYEHANAGTILREAGGYAEPLFTLLGAKVVDSLDASDFESATLVHDLNRPIPTDLHERFTAVVDSGSLEHVFDFPTAVANCMRLAAPNGHVMLVTPTNNLMGHGFYQFSPDLLYRVFANENGYEVESMVVFESRPRAPWYAVGDPKALRQRVELRNSWETYLAMRGRRTHVVELFANAPQQSDYAAAWSGAPFVYQPSVLRRTAQRLIPGSVRRAIRRGYGSSSYERVR